MKRHLAIILLAMFLANPVPGDEAMYKFIEKDSKTAELIIDVDRASPFIIPDGLFGKFTENLGNNIYGGFWAQVLGNPSLEPVARCRMSKAYSLHQKAALKVVTHEELPDAYEEQNLAYWWFRWNGVAADYEFSEDAWNSGYSQVISAREIPEGASGVGIRQLIYLPGHRVGAYHLSFYAKGSAASVRAEIREVGGSESCLGSAEFTIDTGNEWKKYSGELRLDVAGFQRGMPLWFTIGLARPGRIALDQITLFPADAVDGFDPEVVRWAKASRIRVLRFPGGNYASGYHWKDDLVPMDKRPTRPNPAWDISDPHHVGTDEHIKFCRLIGAEPLICVNAGDGTAPEAAEWVEYCNGGPETKWGKVRAERGFPEPYRVKLWEIGNELWGDWQIGHCSADEYPDRYRAFYEAMKAVDPGIHCIACGHVHEYWNAPLIDRCPDILSSLSVHLLMTNDRNSAPEYCHLSHMGYSSVYEEVFRRIHEHGRRQGIDLKVAITEAMSFNFGYDRPDPATVSEALYYAGILNSAIRTEGMVELFTHTALVNHGGDLRKERSVVFADPVYYARQELQTLAGGRPVAVEVRCRFADVPEWQASWAGPDPNRFPLIDAMAVRKGDGLWVVLLNRSTDTDFQVEIHIRGGRFLEQAEFFELSGASFLARNEFSSPERVIPKRNSITVPRTAPLVFPARASSLSVLKLRDQGR